MNTTEINSIVENAQMIVYGYAFLKAEEGLMHVVYLHAPYHALLMTQEGEVLETNMDDIEINIVLKYWNRNQKLLEEAYA